ncbi:MAG: hypothetical protein JRC86_06275 [Deltaproteobacteria bacterium]|nr:hypothetical protein [Deltaproteobacteria bacterium]
MIERLRALFEEHYHTLITWYNGLTDVQQVGVLAGCFFVVFIIIVLYMLSKITHR